MKNGFESYLVTALWSSLDGENPLDDNYSIEDFDTETLHKLSDMYQNFYDLNYNTLVLFEDKDGSAISFGHNVWLTQNGHGAGFWDGDYINGDELTEAAEKLGHVDLYIGDDNKIHAMISI